MVAMNRELTPEKEAYLIKLAVLSLKYRLKSPEDFMAFYGIPKKASKKDISDSIKKRAEDYSVKRFGRNFSAQYGSYPYSYGDNDYDSSGNYYQNDYETNDLKNRLLAGEDDATISNEVSELLVNLTNTIQRLASSLYGFNISEAQALKVTKEALKIISARVADVPIISPVNAIDRYLDQMDKKTTGNTPQVKNPPGAVQSEERVQQPAEGGGAAQPGAFSSGEPSPQERKNIPPWAVF